MKLLILALCALLLPAFAAAAVLTVTPATWPAQLKAAQPGDTLALTGDFPALTVAGRQGLALDLTAATLPTLTVKASQDIAVNGGRFTPTAWMGGVYVIGGSQRISVSGVDIAGGGLWNGVTFRDSSDVSLTAARIDRARVGVTLIGVTGARLSRLDLLGYAIDGLDIAASHDVVAEFVTCAGARLADGHHPDCAQLMGTVPGAVPTSDVTFRAFQVSGPTQGVGGYDHGTGGFARITVEDSVFAISYPQAIPLDTAPGSIVRRNVVRTLPGSRFRASINTDATVARCGNVVSPGAGKPGVTDPACPAPLSAAQ